MYPHGTSNNNNNKTELYWKHLNLTILRMKIINNK